MKDSSARLKSVYGDTCAKQAKLLLQGARGGQLPDENTTLGNLALNPRAATFRPRQPLPEPHWRRARPPSASSSSNAKRSSPRSVPAADSPSDGAAPDYPSCVICCETLKVLLDTFASRPIQWKHNSLRVGLCTLTCLLAVSLNCYLPSLVLLQAAAVGACNHKDICAPCSLRMRMCYGQFSCPLCKAELKEVRTPTIRSMLRHAAKQAQRIAHTAA